MAPQRNTDSRDSRHNHSPVEGAKGHWERPAHASSAYGDPYRTLPPTVEEEAATPDRVTTFFDTPEFRDARAQLLARQQGNVQRIQQHERVLEDHCPGATLTDMAAGEHTTAPPRVTADSVIESAPGEKFHEPHIQHLKSEPTSKATRGYK